MTEDKKRPRTIWIFDFDGTLSEIVSERYDAVLQPDCRKMLTELIQDPDSEVAIISSRTLEDISNRVPLQDMTLVGSSGLEWRLPSGEIRLPGDSLVEQVSAIRSTFLPVISLLLNSIEEVELEDKTWSITVHYRNVPPPSRLRLRTILTGLRTVPGLRLLAGPEATEIMLLPEIDKRRGVRELMRLLRISLSETRVVYAGDDQNDATAMRWVLSRSGIAIIVGDRIKVKGAVTVPGPAELAKEVVNLKTSWKQEQLFKS